jgi:hypothetical protein
MTKAGKVVYYDPKEGKYYDPDSDFYIDHDDYMNLMKEDDTEEGWSYTKSNVSEETGFIKGDKVRHKEQQLGIGTIMGDPEGDEYPVKFDGDDEIYYAPTDVLELAEEYDGPVDDLMESINRLKKLSGL